MKVFENISELIGNTPIVRLNSVEKNLGLKAAVYAKVEAFNPAGSAKDRVGMALIQDAQARGLLKPGATIIEPTSGNTGIGLASYAASRGYRVILTMPDTMSIERRNLLRAFGAELVLTEGTLGMQGAVDKASELAAQIEGSFIPGQFDNPANPKIHYETTCPGNIRSHGWENRLLCGRRRHGRHHHGSGPLSEKAGSCRKSGGGGTCFISSAFRGKIRLPRPAGYRGKLCTVHTRP